MAPGGEGKTMTVAGVESLLALLRPAVESYGGCMEVVSVEGGVCRIKYTGPDAIWTVCSCCHGSFKNGL
jgi:Fe-S cluster biogenesis protein NfuA